MLGCWRSSWARSAPAAVGECPPGGRRRRLLLGAALRPPCPRACSPASRAAQVHVRALLTTQCFQHCQFLLAHRLSHFEKVLGEPRFTTWATLAAHLCLVVAGVRAAGISVARQPSARTLQPHRAPRAYCTQLILTMFAVRRCSMPGDKLGQVRQPAPAGPSMAASCARSAPTAAGANSPSALSTALNSGLISRPTSRTCCRSPGSTPGLLWVANHTCLCAGSLLQVAGSRCGGVGGKRR